MLAWTQPPDQCYEFLIGGVLNPQILTATIPSLTPAALMALSHAHLQYGSLETSTACLPLILPTHTTSSAQLARHDFDDFVEAILASIKHHQCRLFQERPDTICRANLVISAPPLTEHMTLSSYCCRLLCKYMLSAKPGMQAA